MIKQAKNKQKLIRTLEIFLLISGCLIQYLIRKKMGVQRTIIYYNYLLENDYHIKELLFIFVLLSLIYIIYRWFKYKKFSIISTLCTLFILLLIFVNQGIFKLSKYAISIILVLVNILEIL